MNYGDLIRDAWLMTWRYRFLWVLGLFTGTGVSSCTGFSGNGFQMPSGTGGQTGTTALPSGLDRLPAEAMAWIAANAFLVLAAVVVVGLIALVLIVLSLIAQGGMTLATARLGEQRPVTAGEAWRGGFHFFWRFLGLAVLVILAVLAVVGVVAIVAGVVIAASSAAGALSPLLIVLGGIVGLALILVAIPVFIAVSVIVAYAQRAMVVDDIGPVAGLRTGWRLVRRHLGSSLLLWLINLGLSIGAGIVVLIGAFCLVLALVLLGLVFWVIFHFTAPTYIYIGLAVVALIAAFWLAQAIVNTFLWSYWTLAYLRLSGVPPVETPA